MISRHNLVIAALIISSMTLMGNGIYIKAKAKMADWLIHSSWEARQANGEPQKPWPWADTWVVARISVPRLGVSQYVMQDASGESLAFGPGAVIPFNTMTYKFIAGHRDTHFNYLDALQLGDRVEIEDYKGHKSAYQITSTQVVDTRNGPLRVDEQLEGLSLMTCWPMDSVITGGPLRYLVSAESFDV